MAKRQMMGSYRFDGFFNNKWFQLPFVGISLVTLSIYNGLYLYDLSNTVYTIQKNNEVASINYSNGYMKEVVKYLGDEYVAVRGNYNVVSSEVISVTVDAGHFVIDGCIAGDSNIYKIEDYSNNIYTVAIDDEMYAFTDGEVVCNISYSDGSYIVETKRETINEEAILGYSYNEETNKIDFDFTEVVSWSGNISAVDCLPDSKLYFDTDVNQLVRNIAKGSDTDFIVGHNYINTAIFAAVMLGYIAYFGMRYEDSVLNNKILRFAASVVYVIFILLSLLTFLLL